MTPNIPEPAQKHGKVISLLIAGAVAGAVAALLTNLPVALIGLAVLLVTLAAQYHGTS